MDDQQVAALLEAAKGTALEYVIIVALFTGMRQSGILGFTWDAVDCTLGAISVNKQLSRLEHREQSGLFVSPGLVFTNSFDDALLTAFQLR